MASGRSAGALASTLAALLLSAVPASGGTPGPAIESISPTSGSIGSTITVSVTGCFGGANEEGTPDDPLDDTARLDFAFADDPATTQNESTTPANSEFFVPADDGSATVTIQALDKEGQTETYTTGRLVLSQCLNEGSDEAAFAVTRGTVTTSSTTVATGSTTTTTPSATTTTRAAGTSTTTTAARAATTTTAARRGLAATGNGMAAAVGLAVGVIVLGTLAAGWERWRRWSSEIR